MGMPGGDDNVRTAPARLDPRVARTRAAIRDAFAAEVAVLGPAKVTVKGVTERAGINRKTFYLHYESIETLFDEVLGEVMDEFFATCEVTPEVPEDMAGHAERFFLFMASQPQLVETLVCSPAPYYDFGDRLYREQMARYRSAGDPFAWMPTAKEELVLNFIRAAALGLYRQWVHEGKAVPPEEAAALLGELTLHGVDRLMR